MIECNLAIIADDAVVGDEGKLHIIGAFWEIRSQGMPAPIPCPNMVAVFGWAADPWEVAGKANTFALSIVDEDGKVVIERTPPLPLHFPVQPTPYRLLYATAITSIKGAVLPHHGSYVVQAFLNDKESGRIVFHVA